MSSPHRKEKSRVEAKQESEDRRQNYLRTKSAILGLRVKLAGLVDNCSAARSMPVEEVLGDYPPTSRRSDPGLRPSPKSPWDTTPTGTGRFYDDNDFGPVNGDYIASRGVARGFDSVEDDSTIVGGVDVDVGDTTGYARRRDKGVLSGGAGGVRDSVEETAERG
eukprot:Rmarinus@m.19497